MRKFFISVEIIGYICSLLIGVSLGLIGSGGSILAIPILVYFFGLTPEHATTHSLFIVGITAAIASYKHYKTGNLKIKEALAFSVPSIISLLLTRKFILPVIPEVLFKTQSFALTKHVFMMVLFAALMILASTSMIKKRKDSVIAGKVSTTKLLLLGLGLGVLTGFLGAGGGFLIVPVLIFYAGISLRYAIATSLFIIMLNSLSGFLGDLVNQVEFNKFILATVSSMAIIGMFIGLYFSKKIDGKKLKPMFGYFILAMGLFITLKELYSILY